MVFCSARMGVRKMKTSTRLLTRWKELVRQGFNGFTYSIVDALIDDLERMQRAYDATHEALKKSESENRNLKTEIQQIKEEHVLAAMRERRLRETEETYSEIRHRLGFNHETPHGDVLRAVLTLKDALVASGKSLEQASADLLSNTITPLTLDEKVVINHAIADCVEIVTPAKQLVKDVNMHEVKSPLGTFDVQPTANVKTIGVRNTFDLVGARDRGEAIFIDGRLATFIAHLPENTHGHRVVVSYAGLVYTFAEDGRANPCDALPTLTTAPKIVKTVGYKEVYLISPNGNISVGIVHESEPGAEAAAEENPAFFKWKHTTWQYDGVEINT